jgi:hypothetical protein
MNTSTPAQADLLHPDGPADRSVRVRIGLRRIGASAPVRAARRARRLHDLDRPLRDHRPGEGQPLMDLDDASIDLYWLPLGAGGRVVRCTGKIYEALLALVERRPRQHLYHSALEIRVSSGRFIIEMTPVGRAGREDHGRVATGSVGSSLLGRFRLYQYEIRRWRSGRIDDIAFAVASPVHLSSKPELAQQVLDLAPIVPTPVWGRDALHTGEMWNSNSVTSWLLATAGIDLAGLAPPHGGRAPGWSAGLIEAARTHAAPVG